jgi:hypothetical protein
MITRIGRIYRLVVWVVLAASVVFAMAISADLVLRLGWGYNPVHLLVACTFALVSLFELRSGRRYFRALDSITSKRG